MIKKSILIIKNEATDKTFSKLLEVNFSDEFDFFYSENIDSIIQTFVKTFPFLIIIDFETIKNHLAETIGTIKDHKKLQLSTLILLINRKNLSNIKSLEYEDFIIKPINEPEFLIRFKLLINRVSIKNENELETLELNQLLKEKEKLNQVLRARDLALNKSAAVAIINKKGIITFINDKFCSSSKFSKHELIGKNFDSILYSKNNIKYYRNLWVSIYRGEIWRGEICSKTKFDELIWTDTSISPIYDDKGKINKFFTVHFDITESKQIEEELQDKNYSVTTSINYASRIQTALLPSENYLKENLKEHFVVYKPRDIVSGDFYWVKQISNFLVVAVADCTGHGVPGAFMSMLGFSFLNEIVTFRNSKMPSQILNELRLMVKKSLHQDDTGNDLDDGMDISIFSIEKNKNKLYFSGALNSIYIIRNSNLEEITGLNITKLQCPYFNLYQIEGDEMPIGRYYREDLFQTTQIQLLEDDIIYAFSDGFIDQFGGENNEKFSSKRLKKLLLENCILPLNDQKLKVENAYIKWISKSNYRQIDDILILGLRI